MIYTMFQDKKMSLLGFGAMRLPVLADGTIDEPQVKEMTRYAMEHGYLPYEDMLFGEDALAREGFTAADMGYVQIHTAWGITAAEKE